MTILNPSSNNQRNNQMTWLQIIRINSKSWRWSWSENVGSNSGQHAWIGKLERRTDLERIEIDFNATEAIRIARSILSMWRGHVFRWVKIHKNRRFKQNGNFPVFGILSWKERLLKFRIILKRWMTLNLLSRDL